MSAWQPIETAPRDGTLIDVWAYWPEHDTSRRTPNAFYETATSDWRLGQYRVGQFVHRPVVTHWMPAPAAPGQSSAILADDPSQALAKALELAAWRFDYLAKQMRKHTDMNFLAPSLEEAAADANTALKTFRGEP